MLSAVNTNTATRTNILGILELRKIRAERILVCKILSGLSHVKSDVFKPQEAKYSYMVTFSSTYWISNSILAHTDELSLPVGLIIVWSNLPSNTSNFFPASELLTNRYFECFTYFKLYFK